MNVDTATAIIGIVILVITNIVSLSVAIRKAGRKEGLDEGKVNELIEKVNNLPCIKDPNYMVSAGELKGIVSVLSEQFKGLSDNLAEVNRRLDNWIIQSNK
jgi:hypothetical protein